MSEAIEGRFSRQEGLVEQRLVQGLRVNIVGTHPLMTGSLATIAEHLGVAEFPSTDDPQALLVLDPDGELPDGVPAIHACLLDDGFSVGEGSAMPETGEPAALLAPGLAIAAAAIAWQEVLRLTGCIRRLNIVKRYAAVHFRIDPRYLGFAEERLQEVEANWDGDERMTLFTTPCDDGTGHVHMLARIDVDSPLVQELLDSVELAVPHTPEPVEPCQVTFRIPQVEEPPKGGLVVAGVGGLGSWSMHAIRQGIEQIGGSGDGLNISLFDPDTAIEVHNLNRQVLYSETELGQPKATAAKSLLQAVLETADVQAGVQAIGLPELDSLIHENGAKTDATDDLDLLDELDITLTDTLADAEVNALLQEADVLLCGVDNLHARGILSAMAAKLDIPFINAGSEGFGGQFDLFHTPGCMACRYGAASVRDRRVTSCQEDGDIPVSSIVTTTALFGALEGLAALCALSDPRSLEEWPKQVTWGGRSNVLRELTPPLFMRGDDHVEHVISALQVAGTTPEVNGSHV